MPLLAQVNLASSTGLVEDSVINNFTVRTGASFTVADALAAAVEVAAFYNTVAPGAGDAPATFLSQAITRTALAHTVKMYELDGHLDGSPHGSPVVSHPFTILAASVGAPWPTEVAAVITFEADGRETALVETADGTDLDSLPDRPKQRHTGRVYFGPLTAATGAESEAGYMRPTVGFRDSLMDGIEDLETRLAAIASGNVLGLGVWSRKDQTIRRLDHVSMDNAFDTQRRRGVGATSRMRLEVNA